MHLSRLNVVTYFFFQNVLSSFRINKNKRTKYYCFYVQDSVWVVEGVGHLFKLDILNRYMGTLDQVPLNF